MPDIRGPATIKQLKEHGPRLTVLGLSGDDSVDAHNDSLESGSMFFIEKDIGEAKLLSILHRACQEAEKRTKPITVSVHTENQKLIESVCEK